MNFKVAVICACIALSQAFVCPPDACAAVRCAAIDATQCNGLVVKNGGYCGCCDTCQSVIPDGQSCFSTVLLGVGSSSNCADGSTCDLTTMTCVKHSQLLLSKKRDLNPCATELAHYTDLMTGTNTQAFLGMRHPICDNDGFYAPKQCSGSQCYCVAKDGTSIQSYSVYRWEAQDMNDCQCARDLHAYMSTGMIGKLFYCDKNGNYMKHSCVGSVCFCTDQDGNQLSGSQSVNIGQVDTLNC